MKIKKYFANNFIKVILIGVFAVLFTSCEETDNTLAPYVGSPKMSGLTIENKSFTPKITWVGGYVSAIGINKGPKAALDSTLVWLINKSGNGIKYPVKYGELQDGVQDLTTQFGGNHLTELLEDSIYTFWLMKEDVWSIVTTNPEKYIFADSNLTENYLVSGDTLKLSSSIYTQKIHNLDNYINLSGISTFGQLGTIQIIQTNISDNIEINWNVTQAGVTDQNIAAMGIVKGNQYAAANSIWEVYSEVEENGQPLYGKHNVIAAPVFSGDSLANTKIFVEYPERGLERNATYYVWIASKEWDGVGRIRATPYYAYATFNTR